MTYDHWKATNPDDEFLGPKPDAETFDVWQWLPGGVHECVGRNLDGKAAVERAHSYTTRPAAKIGIIERVTIVSTADDSTVFEWTYGKGITFK